METNEKYLSIPPYLSTSWKNIRALRMQGSDLLVTMMDGQTVVIPNLGENEVEIVFASHSKYLEEHNHLSLEDRSRPARVSSRISNFSEMFEQGGTTPFRFGFGGFDGLGNVLQHNQEQSHAPDLPKEILQKIAAIAKIVVPDDPNSIPKAEPHCNCVYCQIARAIERGLRGEEEEEEVSDEDLKFRDWDIVQSGDNLYTVSNPLNSEEKYNVHLGEPIGCTCGQSNCEHLLAVLRS